MGPSAPGRAALSRPTLEAVKIPIACTLQPGDARAQLGEWQDMLGRITDRSERASANRLELTLVDGADVGALIDLARREAACCGFFSFTIEIHRDRLVLVVEVPDDAVETLDGLAAGGVTRKA